MKFPSAQLISLDKRPQCPAWLPFLTMLGARSRWQRQDRRGEPIIDTRAGRSVGCHNAVAEELAAQSGRSAVGHAALPHDRKPPFILLRSKQSATMVAVRTILPFNLPQAASAMRPVGECPVCSRVARIADADVGLADDQLSPLIGSARKVRLSECPSRVAPHP